MPGRAVHQGKQLGIPRLKSKDRTRIGPEQEKTKEGFEKRKSEGGTFSRNSLTPPLASRERKQ